jgi:hypothetical protein
VQQLRDATIEEQLEAVFYLRSVLRGYKQDKPRFWLFARKSPVTKGVKMDAEETKTLEAVTRRRPVKIQKTEKTRWVL